MSALLTRLASARGRVALANNCNIPNTYFTGSNWVQNCWTKHRSGPAGYSNIEVTFINGTISTNSEQNAYYDFVLRAGLYVGGQFYQFLFDGATETTVSKNWGIAIGTVSAYIPPNTDFYITNRRVAADNGAAGTYNVITNTAGITARQDGQIAGTSTALDFTLGSGVAYGAKCAHPPTINNGTGAITAISVDTNNRGTGYTAGLNLVAWYGPAGSGQPGKTAPGTGLSGYGVNSSGQLSSVVILDGDTSHNSSSPPRIFVGGAGNAASGFGTTTAAYGPSLITGIPRYNTPSVLIVGDSIAAGYGSVYTMGDLNASYGFYEQVLADRYGVHKLAVSGESCAGWLTTHTQQLNFMDAQIRRGLRPSHVLLTLGLNDFLTNTNTDVLTVVQSYVTQMANMWRDRGAKILLTTIPPNNTTSSGSNKYTTIVEQTPYNSNFTLGSKVDQYNAALLAGTGPANNGVIDVRALMQDATTTTAWRVDCYGGTTAFCATDGTHPSVGVGIPYMVANLTIPALH